MKARRACRVALAIALSAICCAPAGAADAPDPLPSWNDGPAKSAIVAFVRAATDKGSPQFVPPEERIAAFDNDGTLWVEQPLYTQVMFAIDRVKVLAQEHPDWKTTEPFKAILTGDRETLARLSFRDFARIVAPTHSGMTVEEFEKIVQEWLLTARHPRFERPYTELTYLPMLEVMRLYRAAGFKVYIVTGGGQDFVRAFADPVYAVAPEQVIGSAAKMSYEYAKDGTPRLIKQPQMLLIDDRAGKPEGINLIIGRRPLTAFGNSTGDQQMLEWTQGGTSPGPRLMMLVHHDDAEREYAYGAKSEVGTFSDALMTEAKDRGWTVISMKNDWKRIFAFEK